MNCKYKAAILDYFCCVTNEEAVGTKVPQPSCVLLLLPGECGVQR